MKQKIISNNIVPDEIFIWVCEKEISKHHFDDRGKAVDSVFRKFEGPECFSIQKYTKDVDIVALKKTVKELIEKIENLQKLNKGVSNA